MLALVACSVSPTASSSSEVTAMPTVCGAPTDVCDPLLCGWDCASAGQACSQRCFPSDGRAHVSVKADITGDVKTSVSAPRAEFAPAPPDAASGISYGCELEGVGALGSQLKVRYADWTMTSASRTITTRLDVTIPMFKGPGMYAAEPLFDQAATATTPSVAYIGAPGVESCMVKVNDNGGDGIKGTFHCAMVPSALPLSPSNVTLDGSFVCPGTTLGALLDVAVTPGPTPIPL
jgi:hypothetical protein